MESSFITKRTSFSFAIKYVRKQTSAIYSSTYKQAIETVEPLAQTLGLSIQLDKRLIERKLSSQSISDQAFEATLKQLWKNPAISLPGGESNLTAQKRALSFLQDLEKLHQNEHIIISSHGNLICILLNYFDDTINYNFWKQLPMPAVLVLKDGKIYLQLNLSLFYKYILSPLLSGIFFPN